VSTSGDYMLVTCGLCLTWVSGVAADASPPPSFLHAGTGVLHFGDGGSYSGEFRDGEIHGTGTRTWPDGSTYTGEFVLGEKEGTGAGTVEWDCLCSGDGWRNLALALPVWTWQECKSWPAASVIRANSVQIVAMVRWCSATSMRACSAAAVSACPP